MKIVVVDDEALLVKGIRFNLQMRCSPAPMGWKRWNLPGTQRSDS